MASAVIPHEAWTVWSTVNVHEPEKRNRGVVRGNGRVMLVAVPVQYNIKRIRFLRLNSTYIDYEYMRIIEQTTNSTYIISILLRKDIITKNNISKLLILHINC